jgi:hypothetical protein
VPGRWYLKLRHWNLTRGFLQLHKEGIAPTHPFPEPLALDETAEPLLKSNDESSPGQWLNHDAWHRTACLHSGRLIQKRLGNVASIANGRGFLEAKGGSAFNFILESVVYSGVHGGDMIRARESRRLLGEARSGEVRPRSRNAWRLAISKVTIFPL